MSFLDILASKGVLKDGEAQKIVTEAEENGEDIDDVLERRGLSESVILQTKSEYLKVPFKDIDSSSVAFDTLKYIPEESASYYKFVPLGVTDGLLEVGVVDPDNMEARDALQFISSKVNLPFKIYLISKKVFLEILNNYKGLSGEVGHALDELETTTATDIDFDKVEQGNEQDIKMDQEKIVEDAPVTKIVAVILRHATEGNASDIHIENIGDKVKVRFRVDGILYTSLFLPINVYSAVVARIKIVANLKLDEKRKPQDGRFSAKMDGRKIDIRVSTFPTYYGEKVVMRILDSEKGVKPLDQIGLSDKNLASIRSAMQKPYGLILISGPTGSGKTTTLYSMLNEFDREKRNVVSLEDPVEYNIPDMNQSQIMPEIGYTFATGLRSILRQDPDIIMVGEIRDKETAQLAIQSALTGHLVLSTIHTNSAIGVIPRLVDMGVDPYLIAPTLIMSIAQRLSRVICPSSRKAVPIDGSLKMMIDKQFEDLPPEFKSQLNLTGVVHEAEPSPECPAGTRGRIAVFEILNMDKEIESVILKDPTELSIYKMARNKGMLTMKEDAILKTIKGEVPFTEINSL